MSNDGSLIIVPDKGLIEFVGTTHPLRSEVKTMFMPEGATLLEMLHVAQPDPVLLVDAIVFIDDYEIPRENWRLVRPKIGHVVTARVIPYPTFGGGGGGKKNPLRILLTIAVIAASFFLGPALGAALGLSTSFAIAGTTINLAAIVGGAIISIAGNLLINAIAPIRAPRLQAQSAGSGGDPRESPALFLTGSRNSARVFDVVPQVLGFFRFRPPLGAQTFTEIVGDTTHLRMLVVPGYGRLDLSDWEIDETPIDNFEDVELEVKEGVAADSNLTLYGNQVNQSEFSILLKQVDGFTIRTSALDADELSVDIAFPRGLVAFNPQGAKSQIIVVLQIQFRKVGDPTWLDIPVNSIAQIETSPSTSGSGYVVGDIVSSTEGNNTSFRVTSIDGSGGITGLTLLSGGSNNTTGSGKTLTGGTGVGGFLEVLLLVLPAKVTSTISPAKINISGPNVTFTAGRTTALRHGFRWETGERAQYEVRIQRTTADRTSDQVFDTAFWASFRAFTLDDPINFRVPLAKAALKIRATNQLNGVVGSLSVLAKSYAPTFDGTPDVWTVPVITNNPAALFRHVLQGPARITPTPDSAIDITQLEKWYDFCVAKGFTYNQVRDFSSSVQATLEDIASSGRAGLTINDGKWSVVIDDTNSIITTHITPRNSRAFEIEKSFEDLPHAWRFRFPNEDKRFTQDERLVFFDGFSIDGSEPNTVAATIFSDLEIPGVTNSDQAFKLGRYLAAVIVNRPERWSVQQDFESIIARRGVRVKLTHDVVVVGLASGRIASVTVDGGNNVDTIAVDEPVVMEAGKLYGISIRRDVLGSTEVLAQVTLNVGEQTTLAISPVIPAATAPDAGDLWGFGIRGLETEDALVLGNIPSNDHEAKIIMVPYREAVFDADSEIVPPFVPVVSDGVFLPIPEIQDIITDESVLEIGAGDTTLVRAEIRVLPIADETAFLEVQQRLTHPEPESFYSSSFTLLGEGIVRLNDVAQGETWDFRVRWNSPEKLVPSPWATSTPTLIVGLATPPDPLGNLTISVFGGQALLRWDEPTTLDVRFGGTVKFRHTAELVTPLWQESVSIGQAVNARALFATLPLKAGSYLARVFDSSGNPSTIVSVTTKQASVLQFANVDTIDEAPSFSGTHTNTVASDNELKLSNVTLIDSIADWDSIANFDNEGGIVLSGTYLFSVGFDLTTVQRVRLTVRVTVRSDNVNDSIDLRTENIDTWEDFDGTLQGVADLIVEVRNTDDDPGGAPTWSDWERLDSAEFEARGFEFRAQLFTNDPAFNIICTVLGVDVENIV